MTKNSGAGYSRLDSLDVFRGIAIAGMIIVNNPGSWQYAYPGLRHAGVTGYAPADLVFPFFLFIIGASAAFSLPAPARGHNHMPARVFNRIIRRSFLLFLIGICLNAFPVLFLWLLYGLPLDFRTLRITGILQRISLTYCCASFLIYYVRLHTLWFLTVFLLLGYWGLLVLVPVPGFDPGTFSPEGAILFYSDTLLVSPFHLYSQNHVDPEGFSSTISALVTVLSGFFAGRFVRLQPVRTSTGILLFCSGLCSGALGYLWSLYYPISKDLWTGSYVLITSAWALCILSVCYELIEVRKLHRLGLPFRIMGLNAIFFFVASSLVARILLNTRITSASGSSNMWFRLYDCLFVSWLGRSNMSSLAFTLTYLFLWWLILYGMYRRRWFIKI